MDCAIVVATGNLHKLEEIGELLQIKPDRLFSSKDFPEHPEPVEDGHTFQDNALIKALALHDHILGKMDHEIHRIQVPVWVLADDSGLEVDALKGAPGVHSARYASPELGLTSNAPDSANNQKLINALMDVAPDARSARFKCAIACVKLANPEIILHAEGTCEGAIALEASGSGGFGYDPLFLPAGYSQSLASLGGDLKSTISHRFQAVNTLLPQLVNEMNH